MKEVETDKLTKADSEFNVYKKEIEEIDNVILCVAKAEKMVREIGLSLLREQRKTDGEGDPQSAASDHPPSKRT